MGRVKESAFYFDEQLVGDYEKENLFYFFSICPCPQGVYSLIGRQAHRRTVQPNAPKYGENSAAGSQEGESTGIQRYWHGVCTAPAEWVDPARPLGGLQRPARS